MTRGRFLLVPWLRVVVALATLASLLPAAQAGAQALKPVRVSDHVWYVQGDSGMASAANQGFNSNAGFVVTRDSVIVIDALGGLLTPPRLHRTQQGRPDIKVALAASAMREHLNHFQILQLGAYAAQHP